MEERGEYNWPNGKRERKGGVRRQGERNSRGWVTGRRGEEAESREADEYQGQRGEGEKRQPNETFSKGEEGSWTT